MHGPRFSLRTGSHPARKIGLYPVPLGSHDGELFDQFGSVDGADRLDQPAYFPVQVCHLITEKRYSMAHVIPAVLHYAAPATIGRLAVVTLSFSRVMVDLLAMMDAGQIGSVDFLYSVYFRSNNRDACEQLAAALSARGQRVFAGLIHAKLLLIETTDGSAYTVESSANLRSCASVEQVTIFHDRALHDFHRAWIGEILEAPRK